MSGTAVATDPRGMSRSLLDGPATDQLAEQLGTTPVTARGDHDAVTRRPGEFADLLRRVLAGA